MCMHAWASHLLSALLLLLASLFGSYVNIPIAQLPGQTEVVGERVDFFGFEYVVPAEVDWPGTIIAINLGGAATPIALSLYLLFKNNIWLPALIATAVVSAVCYWGGRAGTGRGHCHSNLHSATRGLRHLLHRGVEPGGARRLREWQPWDADRRGFCHELPGQSATLALLLPPSAVPEPSTAYS